MKWVKRNNGDRVAEGKNGNFLLWRVGKTWKMRYRTADEKRIYHHGRMFPNLSEAKEFCEKSKYWEYDLSELFSGGRSKYRAEKVTIEGEKFDSRKEAERYYELKMLEHAGEIGSLRRQVSFELIPEQKTEQGKVMEKPVKYVADFVYIRNGERIVEDVKGFRTRDYVLKRKLMLYVYGIRVAEV